MGKERSAIAGLAIASNEARLSSWTKTFTDPRLCAAILDTSTVTGTIVETRAASSRLAHAGQQRAPG